MIAYLENLKERLGEEFAVYTELLKTDLASHIGAKYDLFQLYRLIKIFGFLFSKCRKCLFAPTWLGLPIALGNAHFQKLKS